MSLSATCDAEPKSQSFRIVFDSFTCSGEKILIYKLSLRAYFSKLHSKRTV